MIEVVVVNNARERAVTQVQLRHIEVALASLVEHPNQDLSPRIQQACTDGLVSMIAELKAELATYDARPKSA